MHMQSRSSGEPLAVLNKNKNTTAELYSPILF